MKRLRNWAFSETIRFVRDLLENKGFSLTLEEAEAYWELVCEQILNEPYSAVLDRNVLLEAIELDLTKHHYFAQLLTKGEEAYV